MGVGFFFGSVGIIDKQLFSLMNYILF